MPVLALIDNTNLMLDMKSSRFEMTVEISSYTTS